MPRFRFRPATVLPLAVLALLAAGCDRLVDPHDAHAPEISSIQGIDISRHQGVIDWGQVARSGIDFAWIKATEGGDHVDPLFRRNWALAAAAGVRRGAYHFIYWCRPAEDQAAWFVANVPADPDALPPVLDAEWTPQSRTCPGKVSREQALAIMRTILATMEHASGQRPLIYAPLDFFKDVMEGSDLDGYPLWARNLGGPPAYGARGWRIWQYSENGRVGGVTGDVDRNSFAGRRTAWQDWLSMEGRAD